MRIRDITVGADYAVTVPRKRELANDAERCLADKSLWVAVTLERSDLLYYFPKGQHPTYGFKARVLAKSLPHGKADLGVMVEFTYRIDLDDDAPQRTDTRVIHASRVLATWDDWLLRKAALELERERAWAPAGAGAGTAPGSGRADRPGQTAGGTQPAGGRAPTRTGAHVIPCPNCGSDRVQAHEAYGADSPILWAQCQDCPEGFDVRVSWDGVTPAPVIYHDPVAGYHQADEPCPLCHDERS